MRVERYTADALFISGQKLKRFAADHPTPFYLYDEAGIRAEVCALQAAFSWAPGFRQFFPVHLCPNRTILEILKGCGCGVLCNSPSETLLAQEAGFSEEDLLYTGTENAGEADYILDGFHALPQRPSRRVLLRYNPGGRLTFDGRSLANLDRNRLGMGKEELFRLAQHARAYGTEEIGLSFHALTNEMKEDYYPSVAKLLFTLAAELYQQTGIAVTHCCLGDGVGVSCHPERPSPNLNVIARRIRALYEEILVPAGLGDVGIFTTLGRRILAEHGVFLTKVTHIKPLPKPLLLVDAAASQFPEVGTLHYHHISVVGKDAREGRISYGIAGRQLDTQMIAELRVLPPMRVGALLALHTAGCVRSLSMPGSGFPACGEYLLRSDGTFQQI